MTRPPVTLDHPADPAPDQTPATTADPTADPTADLDAIGAAMEAVDADRNRLSEVERGWLQPYHREASVRFIRARMTDAARAYLEAGLELARVAEHEPAAEFAAVLEAVNVSDRTARRMMAVALKYKGRLRELGDRLNAGKLLELTSERDEDLLPLLDDGGTLAGRTLDEIARMSRPQLAAALEGERQARRQDREVADRLLLDKDAKINGLAARLEARDGQPEWPAVIARLTADTTVACGLMLQQIDRLAWVRDQVQLLPISEFPESDRRAADAIALALVDHAETVYADFGRLVADLRQMFEAAYLARQADIANAPAPLAGRDPTADPSA